MKKKLFSVILIIVFTLSLSGNCFAQSSSNSNGNNDKKAEMDLVITPQVSLWHYQNNTPLVGTPSQYTVLSSDYNTNYKFQSNILGMGKAGFAVALAKLIPSPVSAGIAAAIWWGIVNNAGLDTPTLYSHEHYYKLSGFDPTLSQKVVQYWYSDSSHTTLITTTTYYKSFY